LEAAVLEIQVTVETAETLYFRLQQQQVAAVAVV
jgi:hypothetical protein